MGIEKIIAGLSIAASIIGCDGRRTADSGLPHERPRTARIQAEARAKQPTPEEDVLSESDITTDIELERYYRAFLGFLRNPRIEGVDINIQDETHLIYACRNIAEYIGKNPNGQMGVVISPKPAAGWKTVLLASVNYYGTVDIYGCGDRLLRPNKKRGGFVTDIQEKIAAMEPEDRETAHAALKNIRPINPRVKIDMGRAQSCIEKYLEKDAIGLYLGSAVEVYISVPKKAEGTLIGTVHVNQHKISIYWQN